MQLAFHEYVTVLRVPGGLIVYINYIYYKYISLYNTFLYI
jgi:hypothetical protein